MGDSDTKLGSCKIAQSGPLVILYLNGRATELTWEAAQAISAGLAEKGKLAEEYAKANDIIFDQAILYRSGAPMALSSHPKILEEAKKEAVYNRDLRRSNLELSAKAGSIASSENVGVPTITQSPPQIVIPK